MKHNIDLPTAYVNKTPEYKYKSKNIIDEYTLKRQSFNPTTLSPNIFIDKLEQRMELYYSTLYKSCSSKKK